jgi:tRNA dimethylallyltransferase
MTSSNAVSVVEHALRIAQKHPDEILAIVGPTASGKTALAVEIAARIDGEIVGADSVQVYRDFDAGSGKPSPLELARAPHHLVAAVDPSEPVDAAWWAGRAVCAIDDIRARGRTAIVCGGTFLWVKALLFGLAPAPGANRDVRARHRAIVEQEGRPALHARLRQVDADIATRLHPNDFVRVSRALEVHELTGKPMSVWQREHGFSVARLKARVIAPAWEPEELSRRIEARVHAWLANGWIEEVESLRTRGYGGARAMSSVGYAQIGAMLSGAIPRDELAGAIVRATRLFARRQRTWLNHASVTWIR